LRLIIEGERSIRLIAMADGAALNVESAQPGLDFSPLHMLAASLATCTLSVIAAWAMQAGLSMDGLEIELDWNYVDDPYRVGEYDMRIRWPQLPADRRAAALRVAEHCTVEHTLRIPPEIRTTIVA